MWHLSLLTAPHTSGLVAPRFQTSRACPRQHFWKWEQQPNNYSIRLCWGNEIRSALKSVLPFSNCDALYLFLLIFIKHESKQTWHSLGNIWQEWTTLFTSCISIIDFLCIYFLFPGNFPPVNFPERCSRSDHSRGVKAYFNIIYTCYVLLDDHNLHPQESLVYPVPVICFWKTKMEKILKCVDVTYCSQTSETDALQTLWPLLSWTPPQWHKIWCLDLYGVIIYHPLTRYQPLWKMK